MTVAGGSRGAPQTAAVGAVRTLGSRHCIVCGQEHPHGMRVAYTVDGAGSAEAVWTVRAEFQGFDGILHGGAVLGLLDDAMWYAVYGAGAVTLTAEASIRYRAPVAVGTTVRVNGSARQLRGRLWACTAQIGPAAGGAVLAEATASFVAVPAEDVAARAEAAAVHEVPAAVDGGAAGGR